MPLYDLSRGGLMPLALLVLGASHLSIMPNIAGNRRNLLLDGVYFLMVESGRDPWLDEKPAGYEVAWTLREHGPSS